MGAKLVKENINGVNYTQNWEKKQEDNFLKERFRPIIEEYLNRFYLGKELDEYYLKRSIRNGDHIEAVYGSYTEEELPPGTLSEKEEKIIDTILEEELEKKGTSIKGLGLYENIGGGGGAGYAVYGGGWGRSFGNPSLGSRFNGRGFGFGGSANLSGGPNLMYTYSVKPLNQELQPRPTPQDNEETIHTGSKIKGKVLNTNKDIEGQIIHIEEDHDNNIKYYLVLDPEDGIEKKVDPTSVYLVKPEEWVNPFTEDQPVEENPKENYQPKGFYPLLTEKLSPSGALYGFGGWLTTRDKSVTMSAKHNAAIVAELINEFIEKQKLEEPKNHWEKDLIPMNERKSLDELTTDIKGQIERSKKLPKEMKEKIIPLIIKNGIHGTTYNNGIVTRLKIPKIIGKSFKGVDLGADKDGFFVMTHRARSKSKPEIAKIPNKDIKFIESTG